MRPVDACVHNRQAQERAQDVDSEIMISLSPRDRDYVEIRLAAPLYQGRTKDAHRRLKEIDPQLANRLDKAMKDFTDECRRIRTQLLLRADERMG